MHRCDAVNMGIWCLEGLIALAGAAAMALREGSVLRNIVINACGCRERHTTCAKFGSDFERNGERRTVNPIPV